ncbi:hypothetical protein MGG_17517, partial [Pyricularia oryzae 70-15]
RASSAGRQLKRPKSQVGAAILWLFLRSRPQTRSSATSRQRTGLTSIHASAAKYTYKIPYNLPGRGLIQSLGDST